MRISRFFYCLGFAPSAGVSVQCRLFTHGRCRRRRCQMKAPAMLIGQCSFRRGTVLVLSLSPIIISAVRAIPYSAIWCIRYSEM